MLPPPWGSHRKQLSPRPECALQPRSPGAVPWPDLRRWEHPLTIAVRVSRIPEPGQRPALFITPRLDAHIEEDIERFPGGQPAVLVNIADHAQVGLLDVLRIDLEMFDQGLFREPLILLGQTHSERVTAKQRLYCIRMGGQKRLRCEKEVLRVVVGQLSL